MIKYTTWSMRKTRCQGHQWGVATRYSTPTKSCPWIWKTTHPTRSSDSWTRSTGKSSTSKFETWRLRKGWSSCCWPQPSRLRSSRTSIRRMLFTSSCTTDNCRQDRTISIKSSWNWCRNSNTSTKRSRYTRIRLDNSMSCSSLLSKTWPIQRAIRWIKCHLQACYQSWQNHTYWIGLMARGTWESSSVLAASYLLLITNSQTWNWTPRTGCSPFFTTKTWMISKVVFLPTQPTNWSTLTLRVTEPSQPTR